MIIGFVTSNGHKVSEARAVLKKYGIDIEHIERSYEEPSDYTVEETAKIAAKRMAEEYGKPVIVEDTGIFFSAYPGFPGPNSKFVIHKIGYDGVFRLLAGKERKAYFLSVIGYCMPGGEARLFSGRMAGSITDKVMHPEADVLPYERIFIPEGYDKTIVELGAGVKNRISHRARAFHEFGGFLSK
ncbi:MAG: non-canonical purine NTP pyrophosphatase [archaeon]